MARMVINQTPSLSILSPYWLYQRSLYHNDYYPNTTYFDPGKSVRLEPDMKMDECFMNVHYILSSLIYDPVSVRVFTVNILKPSVG